MCHEAMMEKLTFGSLFAGIGGFDLGLERAGMECKWQVEIDPFAVRVLQKHWPDVKRHEDIRNVKYPEPVDVICGGFPCQDLSSAGKQKGFEGERSSLYTEMLRIVSECRPKFTIFENVTNLIAGDKGRWFAKFLYDLAEIGLDAEWHCIQAARLGADHERDRIWVIAYPSEDGNKRFKEPYNRENSTREKRPIFANKLFDILREWRPLFGRIDSKPNIRRVVNGFPGGMDRLGGLGNAVVPQIPELLGRVIIKTHNKALDLTRNSPANEPTIDARKSA